jgi:hypothetical protein
MPGIVSCPTEYRCQRVLNDILRDCTPEERYEMTVKNVVELYNLPFTLEGPSQAKVTAGVGRSQHIGRP